MNTERQKQFVSCEVSRKLKEKLFNEPTMAFYDENGDFKFVPYNESDINLTNLVTKTENENKYSSAPLFQQAFRFFRENYGLINSISEQTVNTFGFYIDKLGDNKISQFREFTGFKTYEDAELACLEELILTIK